MNDHAKARSRAGRFDVLKHRHRVRDWRLADYPGVDVLLPVCGESIGTIHDTWRRVYRLARGYPGEVSVFVLDDGAQPELRAMARDFGFRYGSRPNRGWYKKAGNLQFGISHSANEYVLVLDADCSPHPNLLEELLPYMDDPETGIVYAPQTPLVADKGNWLGRVGGMTQERLRRRTPEIQGITGLSVCTLYRRSALEANGGASMVSWGEDLFTAFDLGMQGYRSLYVPVALSTGPPDDDRDSVFNRQYRIHTSAFELLQERRGALSDLPLLTRLTYLRYALRYVARAVTVVLTPVLPLFLLLVFPKATSSEPLLWLALALFYATAVFPLLPPTARPLDRWAFHLLSGWACLAAVLNVARRRFDPPYRRTRNRIILWDVLATLAWIFLIFWRADLPGSLVLAGLALLHSLVIGRVLSAL